MTIVTEAKRVNLWDAMQEHSKYPLTTQREMLDAQAIAEPGKLYVVRTNGWNRKSDPVLWVCLGGLNGRPWGGPYRTDTEAETNLDRLAAVGV